MFSKIKGAVKATITIGSLLALIVSLGSCLTYERYTYYEYVPQYISWEALRSGEGVGQSTKPQIERFGKIYTKGNYLYINEPNKGIHIFDNSDVNNPVKETFLEVIGNVDLAIKGDRLYADSFTDLLTFDIADLDNITLVKRETNSFPYYPYQTASLEDEPDIYWYSSYDENKGVIVGWRRVKREEVYTNYFYFFPVAQDQQVTVEASSGGGDSGQGGSFARFQVVDNYLYALTDRGIAIFEIDAGNLPSLRKEVPVPSRAGEIETLYYYSNTLFIGSTLGMYISDISDRGNPGDFSEYIHFQACDPVVVQGDYAYVTLRTGTGCNNRNGNELHVVSITNIHSPVEVNVYNLRNPHGLGVYSNSLFVADGDYGLRWFKLENEGAAVSQLTFVDVRETYDVIVKASHVILVTSGGLYQYTYNLASTNISEVSRIE